jgi:hypothetical protein
MSYSKLYDTKICQKQNIHYYSYALFVLYFLGLSLRNTSKVLNIFDDEKQSHIAI